MAFGQVLQHTPYGHPRSFLVSTVPGTAVTAPVTPRRPVAARRASGAAPSGRPMRHTPAGSFDRLTAPAALWAAWERFARGKRRMAQRAP